MPNSLIFAVILAVWAAYLIQHWIRRRDHVATARSVDRFSEAMRVLERRQSMPRADISAPSPRSYSISLTRPAHPDVVVKRARPSVPAVAPRRSARRPLSRLSVTQQRGTALVAGVLALVTGVLVSVLSPVSWWAALAGIAGLLLAVTYVRHSVSAESRRATSPLRASAARTGAAGATRAGSTAANRAGSRAATRTGSPLRAGATRPSSRPSDAARTPAPLRATTRPTSKRPAPAAARRSAPGARAAAPAGGVETHDTDWTEHEAASAARAGRPVAGATGSTVRSTARATELYDVEALDPSAPVQPHAPAELEPVAAAEPEPGTWAPVPVPPPTYTLKARAPRREQEPVGGRHGSTTVEDLPFDGHALALDEEFEDLPPVHSVG